MFFCAVWQWEGDDGKWNPYPPAACALLDAATSSGKASVTLSLGSSTAYKVDLKKMLQINPVTKYKRKIQCQPAEGLFVHPFFCTFGFLLFILNFFRKNTFSKPSPKKVYFARKLEFDHN